MQRIEKFVVEYRSMWWIKIYLLYFAKFSPLLVIGWGGGGRGGGGDSGAE